MQFFPQPVQRYVSNAIGVSTLHSGEQMSCKHLRGVTQREPINFYHGLLCRVATSKWKQISIAQSIICFALFFVGHTRQGLKCRVCKMNVHVDCQDNAKSCQSKSRLLRRQKSTSEIETRVNQEPPLDEESEYRFLWTIFCIYTLATSPNSTESIRDENFFSFISSRDTENSFLSLLLTFHCTCPRWWFRYWFALCCKKCRI